MKGVKRLEWAGWSLIALIYYACLACYKYTWVFVSGDSGDWLASAKAWFIPQPYGSPLYISIAKLVGMLPGSLTANMTWLSIVPAAIAVGLVFQAAKNYTDVKLARVAAVIMLGFSVFTSQAIVIEEYGFTAVFFCAAILAYSANKKYLTIVALSLALAVHGIAALVIGLFYIAHIREWRYWIKTIPIFLILGVAPYGLIVYLASHNYPHWVYWGDFWRWQGSTSNLLTISIFDAPKRILQTIGLVLASAGLAIIPAIRMAKERRKPIVAWLMLTAIVIVWLLLTSSDVMVYPYLFYAAPAIAILAVMGLQKVDKWQQALVMACSCVFIVANCYFLDVRRIDNANPIASTLYSDIISLPDGSYVMLERGGFYTLGVIYAVTQGKDVHIAFLPDGLPDTTSPVFVVNSDYFTDKEQQYATESYNSNFSQVIR